MSDLWTRFRNGDADAFGELIHTHYQDLYHYGIRFTKDEELVKDCIQELFLSIWKSRASFTEVVQLKYYLLKSFRRKVSRELQRNKRIKTLELHFETGFDTELSIDHTLIKEEATLELAKKVRAIISRLSKRQQEIIYLRFYLNTDMEEIAGIMSLNRQSVYNLLHEALKKMKDNTDHDILSVSVAVLLAAMLAVS
ncbi:hypothetical protein F5148DRAFT_1150328 [Russula earlei]|uniref:Uncharacterized protein n=1 Tax=Russula earlei TaxID=71964 RepID=A0ACC0U5X4_9AGAM|nr:hypothetical protein F5148DRAFT_1150328 [Russula earlei]